MYIPARHHFNDSSALHALIEQHALGAWVCHGAGGLIANHVPFLLDRSRGPWGTLLAHVARANPVWQGLGPATPSVVMFQGPQAYITPGWYPSKTEHGKVAPTWNFVVAHAHGIARVVEERDALRSMLQRLTAVHEACRPAPWGMGDAPAAFVDRLMRAIVCIEMPIDRLEGKLKASQDEALQDRIGTVHGLRLERTEQADAMADLVLRAIEADGSTRQP